MDDIDIEIDVDDSNASVEGHFQSNSESQQTFNALVHGLEKYEDLDAFLSQGDVRNVLEFGYDPFQPDRSLPDDPHILESTLDSILGVNEEEEVVGQGIIINEDLDHGFHKSENQGNVEIEIKDAKKYNTRQRRRPNNDSMFIYESPVTTKTSSTNKIEKPKKKPDPNATRGRPKNKIKVPSDGFESGDDEDENQSKEKDEQADQKQSFDDRRLTRRQSQLTGIKPSSILKATQKDLRMEIEEDAASKIGSSEDDNETNSDVTSNASQEKSVQNAKNARKLRSGNKLKSTKKQEENDSLESNDDYDDEGDDNDEQYVEEEDNDSKMTDVLPITSSSDKDEGEKQSKQLHRKDDNDESEGGISDGDFKCASDHKHKEIVEEKKMMSKAPQPALWEKVSIDASPNSDNEPIRIKANTTKLDKSAENAMKERKMIGNSDRKVKDSIPRKKEVDKDQESKDGGVGQKVRTISLEMFVQSSMRKGGKVCRGPGCETSLNLSQKSIYCGQNCIDKYSQYVLRVQAKERSRMGQPSGSQVNDRLVMLEKQTGKILTGPAAPTESTLCTWLTRHPSFEVMLSSQSILDEKKEKKVLADKRMLPPSLRDNPALTKEIKSMAAKLLGQKKEVDDVSKPCGAGSSFIMSSGMSNTVNQLKRPDPTRISVRNVLREALTGRTNGSDDVMVSANEIKSLAMDIEDELCKFCEGVNAKYKYKVKAIVTQIKDMSNKGFFRRLLFGELQPNQLVRLTNEKIASKELAVWNEDSSGLGILGSDATFQTSYEDKPGSPPCRPIFDMASSATSETTSQHGTHFFDMNCKICTGKVPEPTYNPSSKSEAHFGYYSKSITQTSPISSYPLSPSNSKSTLKTPLLPTPSIPPHEFFTSSVPSEQTLQSKAMGGCDVDDGLWTGTIYAKEITSVRINTYLISGSLSSPASGSARPILQEDLPETVHMTGRMVPENVFSFVTQLKGSGRLSKEVAIVYFLPASTSEDSFYHSLYSYLVARNRCGVISSRAKKEVGRIKDLYILPLPANTPPPPALLPFEGPGLPITRGDLILGIIIKHSAQKSSLPITTANKLSTNLLKLPPSSSAGQSQANTKVNESPSAGTVKDNGDDDNESDVDNKVIFNSAKSDHIKDSTADKLKAKLSEETPAFVEDEPYEPFECTAPSRTTAVVTAPVQTQANVLPCSQTSVKTNIDTANSTGSKAPPSRVNVITPASMNLSILASENIAATMLTTLSAVTNSTSLKEQQRMLQELTQKINEQKVILQQQEQSIKTASDSPQSSSSTTANIITGSPQKSSSSSALMHEANLTPTYAIPCIQPLKSSADIISSAKLSCSGTATSTYSHADICVAGDKVQKTVAPVISDTDRSQASAPNISGNILASLPASINQLLSGEAFKNLKNIMANMSTGKQQSQSQIQASQSSSKAAVENLSSSTKEDDPEDTRECNTNVHGDVDYRLEPKKSQSSTDKQMFSQPLHPETANINMDQFNEIHSQKPANLANMVIKKPLLATPPQSPLSIVSQSRSSDNIPNAQNSTFDHKKASNDLNSEHKSETTVWKPLLPRSDSSSHNSSRDRSRRGGSGSSLRRRDDRRDRSRSRERKRKRSPDKDSSQENKKRNDKSHCASGAGESISEVKDGDDSDDVQIIKEERAAADVIEIDGEEGDLAGHDKESCSKKVESKEGSSERSSKKRERTRERSSSRSRHGRRRRRSRSPPNKQQNRTIRNSRSRSPMKRQTVSKINPLNLPHNLPSLFPSLMQIVGGSNLSRKSDPESVPKSSIPSLLDMLDPSILPEKYKKADNSGLLGSYKETDSFKVTSENVDAKSFKKGLLGDFPSQLKSESKTLKDVEDSVNRNLAMLRMESDKLDKTSSQMLVERELNRPHNSNAYENTEGWMPTNSHNPNPAFDSGVRGPNKPSDEERMNPKERTLLPTPKLEEPCNNYPPYPSSHPESWNYPRNDMYPQDNPSFPSNSFYNPGKMHPQMSPPPLMMPRPRNDRPFLRFPQDSMMGPTNTSQGYFNDGQRFHRPRFGPTRFPKRQPYTSK